MCQVLAVGASEIKGHKGLHTSYFQAQSLAHWGDTKKQSTKNFSGHSCLPLVS